MTDPVYNRHLCYSNHADWRETDRIGEHISVVGGYTYIIYKCSICHAEFRWSDGYGHKVPCATLDLFKV